MESRAPDKECIFVSIMPISSPNPVFDYLLELSNQDNSNKWSYIGFGEEIMQEVLNEVNLHILSGAQDNLSINIQANIVQMLIV